MWDEQLKNNLFESIETWRAWDNFNGGYTIIHRTICIESLKQRRRHSHRLTTHRKAFSFIGLFNDVGFVLLSCTHQCYHKYLTKTLSLALCLYVFVLCFGSARHITQRIFNVHHDCFHSIRQCWCDDGHFFPCLISLSLRTFLHSSRLHYAWI